LRVIIHLLFFEKPAQAGKKIVGGQYFGLIITGFHALESKLIKLGSVPFNKSPYAQSVRVGASTVTPLLLGFICYQFVLCFLNTNLFGVSNAAVAAIEGLLLALVAWRVLPTCRSHEIAIVLFLLVYFLLICVVRGEADLTGPRDIVVIFLAYALGRSQPDREAANKALWIISGVVLFWGALEYVFTDAYYRIFDILHYYIARGEASESVQSWVKQNSFVSGMRTSGRTLFPILGDLRVSSVFLEPISMGNYAIIVCLWALSFDVENKLEAMRHFIVALILIIACDSRFASILVVFLLALRFLPIMQTREVVLALPMLTVGGLIAFTLMRLGNARQDDLSGRLVSSGQAVLDVDYARLVGIGIPEPLPDMGIAYTLEHFGVFLVIILWFMFVAPELKDRRASRFRLMLAIYCLGILSISGTSFFSTKTAMVTWFLYGVLCARQKHGKDTEVKKETIETFFSAFDKTAIPFNERRHI
jgi:putative polymerase